MKVRPLYDQVLVEVESEWRNEHVTKSGVIGVVFENDIDRSVGAQRRAKVVATPRGISDNFFLRGIQETVRVGDEIVMHFNSITPDTKVDLSISQKPCYLVRMENIFVIIRDGEYIMYGGRVLAEPIYDEDVIDEGGVRVRKSESGIITEINVKHNLKKARLSHIGLPRLGEKKTNAVPGDIIYYEKDSDFEHEIDGKLYFCMIQDDIILAE